MRDVLLEGYFGACRIVVKWCCSVQFCLPCPVLASAPLFSSLLSLQHSPKDIALHSSVHVFPPGVLKRKVSQVKTKAVAGLYRTLTLSSSPGGILPLLGENSKTGSWSLSMLFWLEM